jgi:beta-glucanase (GH16 family)
MTRWSWAPLCAALVGLAGDKLRTVGLKWRDRRRARRLLVVVGLVACCAGAGASAARPSFLATSDSFSSTPTTPTTLFDDEFNGPAGSAPSSTSWTVFGGSNAYRIGVECMVNDRKHIYQDGSGNLVETATYNPNGVPCKNGSGPYESGGMNTGEWPSPKFSLQYGTVTARIKVPCKSGYGLWPSWWMTGPNYPKGGEIDMLEILANSYHGYNAKNTLWGPTTSGGLWKLTKNNVSSTLWCNAFHVYGVTWSYRQVQYTLDGVTTRTITPSDMQSGWTWPFDTNKQRPLLALVVGQSGGTPQPSSFPQSMLIDWVRVTR